MHFSLQGLPAVLARDNAKCRYRPGVRSIGHTESCVKRVIRPPLLGCGFTPIGVLVGLYYSQAMDLATSAWVGFISPLPPQACLHLAEIFWLAQAVHGHRNVNAFFAFAWDAASEVQIAWNASSQPHGDSRQIQTLNKLLSLCKPDFLAEILSYAVSPEKTRKKHLKLCLTVCIDKRHPAQTLRVGLADSVAVSSVGNSMRSVTCAFTSNSRFHLRFHTDPTGDQDRQAVKSRRAPLIRNSTQKDTVQYCE